MKIIVLDIETTGLNPNNDLILELGMVSLDLSNGDIEILYDQQFHDLRLRAKHRNSWIFENGFMKPEDIRGKKPISDHLDEINNIIDQYPAVTAWNSDFDIRFLANNGVRFKKVAPCPMKASTNFFKINNGNGGYKWPKAQEAYDKLFPDVPFTEEHRGLSDASMEANIIYELFKQKAIWQ